MKKIKYIKEGTEVKVSNTTFTNQDLVIYYEGINVPRGVFKRLTLALQIIRNRIPKIYNLDVDITYNIFKNGGIYMKEEDMKHDGYIFKVLALVNLLTLLLGVIIGLWIIK